MKGDHNASQHLLSQNSLAHSLNLPVIVLGETKYQVSFGGYMYAFSTCDIAGPCRNFDDLLINWHNANNRPIGMHIEVKNFNRLYRGKQAYY